MAADRGDAREPVRAASPRASRRLPTLAELKSLAKVGQNPAIDAMFFPDTPGAKFCSSSPNGSSQHWYVDFQNGFENAGSGSDALVRCVR